MKSDIRMTSGEGASPFNTLLLSDHKPEGERDIAVLDLLILLAERKKLILWFVFGFAVLSAIISLVLPVRYTAEAMILPPQQSNSVGAALAAQLGNLGGMASLAGSSLGMKNMNEMLVSMMKSRTVEDAMVQRYGLMQEYHDNYLSKARSDFEAHTKVDGSGKDGLIRVYIQDHDAKRAAELTNGYIEQFRDLSDHLAITEAAQRRMFFEKQLKQAKDNLANAEEALKTTEQRTGLVQLDSQARAFIESAAMLRAQIATKEVEIQSLETYATPQNAQLIQAQRELAALRAQLEHLGGSEANSEAGLTMPHSKVPEAGMEYVRKLRDEKYYETMFEILAKQYEFAKLDEAKEGAIIQVVDSAVPPDRRSFPKRSLIVLGSTGSGLVLGIGVALVLAALERISKNDPETQSKLNVLLRAMSFRKS